MLTDLNAKISIISFWALSYVKLLWIFFSHFEMSPFISSCQESSWINCQVNSPTKGYFQSGNVTHTAPYFHQDVYFFFFLVKERNILVHRMYPALTSAEYQLLSDHCIRLPYFVFPWSSSIFKSRLISRDNQLLLNKRALNACLLLVSKALPKLYEGFCVTFLDMIHTTFWSRGHLTTYFIFEWGQLQGWS